MTEERERSKEVNESAETAENEEIIELTEAIEASSEEDDEIIELEEEVSETVPADNQPVATTEALQEKDGTAAESASESSDGSQISFDASGEMLDGDIKIGDEFDDDDVAPQDDFLDAMGMDLETNSAISEVSEETESFSELEQEGGGEPVIEAISPDQIEAAIERVIMKMLPEKIDSVITEAIERTLKREIDKLKRVILENATGEKE